MKPGEFAAVTEWVRRPRYQSRHAGQPGRPRPSTSTPAAPMAQGLPPARRIRMCSSHDANKTRRPLVITGSGQNEREPKTNAARRPVIIRHAQGSHRKSGPDLPVPQRQPASPVHLVPRLQTDGLAWPGSGIGRGGRCAAPN